MAQVNCHFILAVPDPLQSAEELQFGEVWSMNPDGSNKHQLTDTADPLNSDNPVWSPDGSKIIFDTNRAGPVELWVMDASGANPTALVPTAGGPASWQPILQPPGEPIPTVSEWGMIVMTLLLLVAGTVSLHRCSKRA